jgi:hypothetical protein
MRVRAVAAGVVLAGASVGLWGTAAGAGETYDEFNHLETLVDVGGVDCKILMTSYRQGSVLHAETYMSTTATACATTRVSASLEFRTASGDTVSTGSADEGPGSGVGANGAADLLRSTHSVTFAQGTQVRYTLNSK